MPQLKADLPLNSLTGVMGVPGYLLMTISPYLAQKFQQHPSAIKTIGRLLIILSAVFAAARYCTTLVDSILDNWISSVSIPGHDLLNTAFLNALDQLKYRSTSRVDQAESASYARRNRAGSVWWSSKHKDGQTLWYTFAGTIYFWDGRLFRTFVEIQPDGESRTWIQTLGFSNQPIKKWLEKVWKQRLQAQETRLTDIYHARDGQWHYLTTKRSRSLKTIDHDGTLVTTLIEDAKAFLTEEREAFYAEKGTPYRRGYLFHGPPGTGKTSMAMAMAGELDLDIQILSLADPELTDAQMATLLGRLEKPSIVLFEDIDSAGLGRETTASDSLTGEEKASMLGSKAAVRKSQVTLSGLLNALDSVSAPEGCYMIMTSNAPETLDPALTREGRIDMKTEFPNAGKVVAQKIFLRFMAQEDSVKTNELAVAANEFAAQIPVGHISPAQLQAYLFECGGSPDVALRNVEAWVKKVMVDKQHKDKT